MVVPQLAKNIRGTDLILGEEWDKDGQYWRCWEFPDIYAEEFYDTVIDALGGKALGDSVWVGNDDWEDPNIDMPQFRQPGYNEWDFSIYGNWWDRGLHERYYKGYGEGFREGLAAGIVQGKGKERGKSAGKGSKGKKSGKYGGKGCKGKKGKGVGDVGKEASETSDQSEQ